MDHRSPLTRDDPAIADEVVRGASLRPPVDRGRLGVYVALGASAGAVPLPWVPDSLLRRVRGALVHDFASRRGLSLTSEAREVLAEPSRADGSHGWLSQAARYVGIRLAVRTLARFGPVAALWPLRTALRTYVLGHLFDRYLELVRTERAVRIDAAEARRVRAAIDGALARAVSVGTSTTPEPTVIDDQRDPLTALVDELLGVAAGVPGRALHRLDAAFDELLANDDA